VFSSRPSDLAIFTAWSRRTNSSFKREGAVGRYGVMYAELAGLAGGFGADDVDEAFFCELGYERV